MGTYRLKKHAERDFWQWVASWAVCISKPSDIGYSDEGYNLPNLNEIDVLVDTSTADTALMDIARHIETSATGYHKERRRTQSMRCSKTAEIVNSSNEQFVVWCGTNSEADELKKLLPDALEVRGSDTAQKKENAAMNFVNGDCRVLISKASIFGYGLNFQNCHNSVFCGMDYSFEKYYQAVRRFYRFGQKNEVNIYRVLGQTEQNILDTINRKADMKSNMQTSMADAMREYQLSGKNSAFTLDLTKRTYDMPQWLRGA
jgi:superfamily II DNA/RNA helicase